MVKKLTKTEAMSEIIELINKGLENNSKDSIRKAWNIKQRYRITLPVPLKRKFCRKCLTPWIAGKTVRVRTREGKIVYYCLNCKKYCKKTLH